MFVNQFAISLFGAMLSMATTAAKNNTLAIIVSVLAIIFYMFLLYTQLWEVGARDRISVDVKKKEYRPHTGLAIAVLANIPNFLIAIIFTAFLPFAAKYEWAGGVCAVTSFFTMLLEGMYIGIISALNKEWYIYFLIILPALITAWVAYYLGFKNKKFTTLFDYQSPDKAKKK